MAESVDPWRLDDFVRAHSSLSERTLAAYHSDVRLFSEWVERSRISSPDAVTRTVVRRYVAFLSTREFARRSIARKAAALRRYFTWAVIEDAGRAGGGVAVFFEDVPAAEHDVVETDQTDEVLDLGRAVLGALAEADRAHLRE